MKLCSRVRDKVCELHSDERSRFEIDFAVRARTVRVAVRLEETIGRVLIVAGAFAWGGRRGGGVRVLVYIFANSSRRSLSSSLDDARHCRKLCGWVDVSGVRSMREGTKGRELSISATHRIRALNATCAVR